MLSCCAPLCRAQGLHTGLGSHDGRARCIVAMPHEPDALPDARLEPPVLALRCLCTQTDSCSSIAATFSLTLNELQSFNPTLNCSSLLAGQQVRRQTFPRLVVGHHWGGRATWW